MKTITAVKTAKQKHIGVGVSLNLETDTMRRIVERNRVRYEEASDGYAQLYQKVKTNVLAKKRIELWEASTIEVLNSSSNTFIAQYSALKLSDIDLSAVSENEYKTKLRLTNPIFSHLTKTLEIMDAVFVSMQLNWIQGLIDESQIEQAEHQVKNMIEKFLGRILYLVKQSTGRRNGGVFSDKAIASMLGIDDKSSKKEDPKVEKTLDEESTPETSVKKTNKSEVESVELATAE